MSATADRWVRSAVAYRRLSAKAAKAGRWRDVETYDDKAARLMHRAARLRFREAQQRRGAVTESTPWWLQVSTPRATVKSPSTPPPEEHQP